jgi:hypothetical protein
MRRAIFSVALLTALALPLVTGASSGGAAANPAGRKVEGQITVRLRYNPGPWVTTLRLKLRRYKLTQYRVCAVWNWPDGRPFGCFGAGSRLPERTLLRIEQNPVAKAMKRGDSPGWGLLGMSSDPVLRVPLSNTVTGDKIGKFYYRATLRDPDGKILLTSNRVTLIWHK